MHLIRTKHPYIFADNECASNANMLLKSHCSKSGGVDPSHPRNHGLQLIMILRLSTCQQASGLDFFPIFLFFHLFLRQIVCIKQAFGAVFHGKAVGAFNLGL